MKRRDFLKTTAATSAIMAAQGYHVAGAADGDQTVNFALVGLGSLSTHQLAPALQKTKHAKLKGIVTGTPAKAEKWSKQYGIEHRNIYNYDNFDQLSENEEIDVIYIVLPNGMHHEFTIRAAEAGKHVLCEKPMAVSSQQCREMIQACEKNNRKLAIGYRCQFEPHHQQCIEFAREQTFGRLREIRAGFGFQIGDPNQWRLDKKLAGGGAMMDVGIYALQACRYLTGEEPASVTAQQTTTNPEKFDEVDETIIWTMKMPSGVNCLCSTTYAYNGVNRFHAYAQDGWFELSPAYSYNGIEGRSAKGPIDKPEIDQFAAEMDAFARVILEGAENRVPGEEGLKDLLAIEAIYKAVNTGRLTEVASV